MSINYHYIDCMEFMAKVPDNFYDVGIVDPNWGRKEHGGVNRSSKAIQKNGSSIYVSATKHKKKNWDDKPADAAYFKELFRVTKQQIIWGANYFSIPLVGGRIIWDKCNNGSTQSDCEIAYNSYTDKVDIFRFMWRGMMQGKSIREGHIQQGNKKLNEKKIHPTQKPTTLYAWTLKKYVPVGSKILDTHLGSGSIGIACHRLGDYALDACENDREMFDAASDWLRMEREKDIYMPKLNLKI